MDTEPGRSLILWTARICVFVYAAAALYWWRGKKLKRASRLWGTAWALCVIHVLCAFHFEHRWSHAAAIEHTAEMTQRVTGWYWGGGLYVNYAFLGVWGLHSAWWMAKGRLSRFTDGMMHGVAAFMMFNATVVFGPRIWVVPIAAYCWLLLRPKPATFS